jgi:acyl carrier protein
MTFEKIAKILAEYTDKDISEIKIDSTFNDLELDSLDTVEIMIMLEDEFSIEIDVAEGIRTVGDLVALVDKAQA